MHPYEMMLTIRHRGYERAVPLRVSSLYGTVQQLVDLGFIELVDVNRAGRRPERTIYAITESGRGELLRRITEMVRRPSPSHASFAAGLMLIHALDCKGALYALHQRAASLEAQVSNGLTTIDDKDARRLTSLDVEFVSAMREAELAWVRRLIADWRIESRWPAVSQT
jgi:DNA-binding PadR family transcriptional regulator